MNAFLSGVALLLYPMATWRDIARADWHVGHVLGLHTIPFALIPAVSWYYGVTVRGWSIFEETIRLTPASAGPICILFFLAMVAGVLFLGFLVRWMSPSYGGSGSLSRSVALVSFTGSPFFVSGLFGLFPLLWLDLLIGIVAGTWCLVLLYRGTSVMMDVASERSFLYASSVLAVALVSLLGLIGTTIILWEFVTPPEYTPYS